jgi:hypothetical protein
MAAQGDECEIHPARPVACVDAYGDGEGPGAARVRKADLHVSVSDPVMDTRNFLNEVTHRYPDAISFAPGRPYAGFFDVEQVFTHMRRYLKQLESQGLSAERRRDTMFQYGPASGQIREVIAEWLRDNATLGRSAEESGVIWTPMSYFYPLGGGEHAVRLSISRLSRDEIHEGVARFARFVEAEAESARPSHQRG